jgi:hypothetical protein
MVVVGIQVGTSDAKRDRLVDTYVLTDKVKFACTGMLNGRVELKYENSRC